ncbi:hypothetical protein ACS2QC_25450 [Bacillus cereus group sp. Bce033]|uniref:hypothetical protein n=1 Tax=Bacillus TaxID=1386 RepID=UPI000A981096|nr:MULTISPECIES: hypothetical protein [Bacillus]MED1305633.1 hypothetical protein [Bacillus pacificus]MCD9103796.1 hypothetical protein [Bacillus sp. PLB03]MCU5563506.1 hypothetical protein [Bacillus paranthracis]MDA1789242.1 hypothetical protein [Bacillus cereus group sp. BY5-1LC]MDA1985490.1 hypothetical protein [Bacillus cereus group sp. Bcc13]
MRFLLFFMSILEDILLISGLSIIVGTTFFVNPIYGWYLLGIILTMLGVVMIRR